MASQTVPPSLAREANMMLQALLTELKQLNVEIGVMLDWRYQDIVADDMEKIIVYPEDDFFTLLKNNLYQYDFLWPIAPESEQALTRLIETGKDCNVKILASDLSAIQLCSDKLATINHLSSFIKTPTTYRVDEFTPDFPAEWVIKPVDGAGCEQTWYVKDAAAYQSVLNKQLPSNFIIQSWLPGQAISLSALFRQGKGWLLTANEQIINNENGCLSLTACRVNCLSSNVDRYQQYIDKIAEAIPELWGYVGVDLIESDNKTMTLLEINPRLTTSYAGISQTIGINVAEQILALYQREPDLTRQTNKTLTIHLDA